MKYFCRKSFDNLHAVGEVPVGGSPRKPPGGGGAVAGVVASGSISASGRPLRGVVIARARPTSDVALDSLAGGVIPSAWARVGVTAAAALRRGIERVGVLLFGTATVWGVCHHVVTRSLRKKRRVLLTEVLPTNTVWVLSPNLENLY